METTVMSFCNQKGGVGKTSTTALVSYNLAKKGYKCLTIDFDPQANLTSLFMKTKSKDSDSEVISVKTTLMTAIKDNIDLNNIKMPIMKNLDLIPNAPDFYLYGRFLDVNFDDEDDRVKFLSKKINKELRGKYDFIFIDVPPTFGLSNDTAFYACDQLVIVLQTQQRALDGADALLNYVQTQVVDQFGSNVDVLGILPVLSERNAQVDREILKRAIDKFGRDNVLKHHIMIMARVKRMDITGITDGATDMWDKRTHKAFADVGDEIISKLKGRNE
ncbi:ParA family protein [Limosilactobacillus fermentum]|uniref:ParA family protein n=1 Tax=Limosilactobacillus fermentum TaxID=1613 RepID=UPI001E4F7A85|nr:AAA family ATPase [Limosilactobacillus fermentum]MCD5423013.1 AAA family ATPase [Limosilactobacillus fermentum]